MNILFFPQRSRQVDNKEILQVTQKKADSIPETIHYDSQTHCRDLKDAIMMQNLTGYSDENLIRSRQ
jgi:hypothetical protein